MMMTRIKNQSQSFLKRPKTPLSILKRASHSLRERNIRIKPTRKRKEKSPLEITICIKTLHEISQRTKPNTRQKTQCKIWQISKKQTKAKETEMLILDTSLKRNQKTLNQEIINLMRRQNDQWTTEEWTKTSTCPKTIDMKNEKSPSERSRNQVKKNLKLASLK